MRRVFLFYLLVISISFAHGANLYLFPCLTRPLNRTISFVETSFSLPVLLKRRREDKVHAAMKTSLKVVCLVGRKTMVILKKVILLACYKHPLLSELKLKTSPLIVSKEALLYRPPHLYLKNNFFLI
jgi:hypothetical protein